MENVPWLPWSVLAASILVLLYACRVLIEDARGGYEVSMGGAGLYSGTWLLGAAGAATGLTMLTGIAWWWAVATFIAIYLLKTVVYRIITALFLGTKAPSLPKDGFKEFIRKTENKDGA